MCTNTCCAQIHTKYVLTIVCTMYNIHTCEYAAVCAYYVEGERFHWTIVILLNPHHDCMQAIYSVRSHLIQNIYQRNTLLLFFPPRYVPGVLLKVVGSLKA